MFDYGCPTCGSTSFEDGSGTKMGTTAPTPERGVPQIARTTGNALDAGGAQFLSMIWMCENGHQVEARSALWGVLELLSVAPLGFGPVSLPRNS
jgi:hypothetical protein